MDEHLVDDSEVSWFKGTVRPYTSKYPFLSQQESRHLTPKSERKKESVGLKNRVTIQSPNHVLTQHEVRAQFTEPLRIRKGLFEDLIPRIADEL